MPFIKRFQHFTSRPFKTASGAWAVLLCIWLILGLVRPAQAEFGSIVDFGLAGDLYFTDPGVNNGQGYINLLMQNNWAESQVWLDLGAGGLVGDTATSYVKAPQMYYRHGSLGKTHFVIGRYLHDWSTLDEYWNMGKTQPNFRWNQPRPETQGLTGLFFTTPLVKKYLELTVFASGLYLPSQGPSYELIDGELTSSNPWFVVPVDEIRENGNSLEPNFEINIPKASDVIFRTSFGGQLASPRNKKGVVYNAFFLDKPSNDLVLPFESGKNASTLKVDIRVLPVVARHQVGGLELGFNGDFFKSMLTWLHESEVEFDAPAGTTYPYLPKQNIYSFIQLLRLSQSQRLWLSYIHVDGENTQTRGNLGGLDFQAFGARNRFDQALRVKWEGLLFKSMGRYRVNASLAYNQSLVRDNVWLSSDFRWAVYRGFEAFWQCDFFGGSEKQVQAVDFISTYQNNDRCLVGGHYAF